VFPASNSDCNIDFDIDSIFNSKQVGVKNSALAISSFTSVSVVKNIFEPNYSIPNYPPRHVFALSVIRK